MMKFRFGDDRGAALVELALTAPLFVLLMMGAIELGRVAYFAIEVENAARAGASYGSLNVGNASQVISNIQQAAKNDAPDIANLVVVSPGTTCVCETLTVSSNTPSFNPSSGTTSCSSSTITSCSGANTTTIKSVVEYVTVSTSATITPLVRIPSLPSSYSLTGYSALRVLPN